jgi:HSP20 family protein
VPARVEAFTLARAPILKLRARGKQNENEEVTMASSSLQNRAESEREREMARRPESNYGYGPFSLMRRMSEEMDRVFNNALGWTRGEHNVWSPAIEVREREGNLEVTAELPGLKKEDVKVECTDEGIIIEGEKKQERTESGEGFHRSERMYGRFYRMIPLPAGAQSDKAKAEFKDGVLQIRVPVPESKQQRRQIPIAA